MTKSRRRHTWARHSVLWHDWCMHTLIKTFWCFNLEYDTWLFVIPYMSKWTIESHFSTAVSQAAFSTLTLYFSVPMHSFVILRNQLPVYLNRETLLRRYGASLNIKMSSYQYRNSHYIDKPVSRPSYLYNWNPIPGKTAFNIDSRPRYFWRIYY